MTERPKRVHRNPYEPLLARYIKEGDDAFRQLGGTPEPHTEPSSHEPDDVEIALYRATFDYIKDQFGEEVMSDAAIAGGIEDGNPTDDDLDIDLYEGALVYIQRRFGIDAAETMMRHLENITLS